MASEIQGETPTDSDSVQAMLSDLRVRLEAELLGHILTGPDMLAKAIKDYVEDHSDWKVDEVQVDGTTVNIRLAPRLDLIEVKFTTPHERGVWCPHKVKILQVDPESRLDYPPMVPIEPWPCTECTWEDFQREEEEMAEEYWREMWAEYRSSQGFG